MNPTDEQARAIELFGTGKSLKIEAGAGTGKTSTLKMLAESTSRRGQYVAFNRAIVQDSKAKMPRTVKCHTAHGLAMSATDQRFRARLDAGKRIPSYEIARILRIDPIMTETFTGDRRNLSAGFLAGLAIRSLKAFCQSADEAPTRRHVPLIPGLDAPKGHTRGLTSYARNDAVAAALEPALKRAWDDARKYEGALRFEHDYYLKMWQLSRPRIWADYIMFDEAQDTSPVLMDAVVQQEQHGTQLVWVGDSQQAIYEFTGAVNALQKITAEHTAYLSQSFRFGPAIATAANTVLRQLRSPLDLKGLPSLESSIGTVEQPRAILTRTNATAVRAVLETEEAGRTAHLVGGGKEVISFAKAARQLQAGERVEHAELACFENWSEVQQYVEEDEQGGDLKLLVNLIDEFTVEVIIATLERMPAEDAADVTVSTAHKSKGREWDTVRLADDFAEDPGEQELRILYVSVTRAKLRLDIDACPQLKAELGQQEAPGAAQLGGQHASPATPDEAGLAAARAASATNGGKPNRPVLILGDAPCSPGFEADDEAAAVKCAEAFHEATGQRAKVIDGNGTIVAEFDEQSPGVQPFEEGAAQ